MMEDVILKCTFTPDPSQDNDIKWEKVGMSGLVHKYQKGNNELTDQNPAFRGRTSLFLSQVMVGNASLKLSRVQLSDTGTYRCIISNSKGNGMDSLTLNVGELTLLQTPLTPLLLVQAQWEGPGKCHMLEEPPLLTGEIQVQWEGPEECHMLEEPPLLTGEIQAQWEEPGECHMLEEPPLLTGEIQAQWEGHGECHMLHLADHMGVPQFLSNIDGGSLVVGPIRVLIQGLLSWIFLC
ncbi:hypothetical protein XELAEV_18011236mg [Xenopus laevis]|uniref:Ig-like domain-containing protein n=1 Tax=Xenopus laevis TaxID=8355 RepID=A0A974HX89_XENLA|nr:hypothetical protein XELAEV_18011236mg [Xenopus laevis]